MDVSSTNDRFGARGCIRSTCRIAFEQVSAEKGLFPASADRLNVEWKPWPRPARQDGELFSTTIAPSERITIASYEEFER